MYVAGQRAGVDLDIFDDEFGALMLAFGSVLQPFREQPWFLSAVRAIDDARRGSVLVEATVSRVESRSSSQSVAANLAMEDPPPEVATMVVEDGAPSSRPITRSASARRSPPAVLRARQCRVRLGPSRGVPSRGAIGSVSRRVWNVR